MKAQACQITMIEFSQGQSLPGWSGAESARQNLRGHCDSGQQWLTDDQDDKSGCHASAKESMQSKSSFKLNEGFKTL